MTSQSRDKTCDQGCRKESKVAQVTFGTQLTERRLVNVGWILVDLPRALVATNKLLYKFSFLHSCNSNKKNSKTLVTQKYKYNNSQWILNTISGAISF